MSLIISRTGLEEFAPGGEARIKCLIVGGPGAGKTRMASYFPKPIYADCEAGLASVADRQVPYVRVKTSVEMKALLRHLEGECLKARGQREYETIVIDTFDAYQRMLKTEWMRRERKEAFTGWEAWGFVGQHMQQLLTDLLNLDMNVVVNVHYKDKTTRDDNSGKETHELQLQLQGDIGDTAFNDFDLVGWMGTYFEAVNGERVQKRGLTFQPTPDKPWLKDRLKATERWMEVTFEPSDYENLFKQVSERVNQMEPGGAVGEIPDIDPDDDRPDNVTAPEVARSGALPAGAAKAVRLDQLDRPTLNAMARERGITKLADGTPIRGNTAKSELLAVLTPAEPSAAAPARVAPAAPQPVANPARTTVKQVPEGLVDTTTGELVEPQKSDAVQEAVATVTEQLGGVVQPPAPAPAQFVEPAAAPAAQPDGPVCEVCGKPLDAEVQDYVKLAWIKYRKRLCRDDYIARKNQ